MSAPFHHAQQRGQRPGIIVMGPKTAAYPQTGRYYPDGYYVTVPYVVMGPQGYMLQFPYQPPQPFTPVAVSDPMPSQPRQAQGQGHLAQNQVPGGERRNVEGFHVHNPAEQEQVRSQHQPPLTNESRPDSPVEHDSARTIPRHDGNVDSGGHEVGPGFWWDNWAPDNAGGAAAGPPEEPEKPSWLDQVAESKDRGGKGSRRGGKTAQDSSAELSEQMQRKLHVLPRTIRMKIMRMAQGVGTSGLGDAYHTPIRLGKGNGPEIHIAPVGRGPNLWNDVMARTWAEKREFLASNAMNKIASSLPPAMRGWEPAKHEHVSVQNGWICAESPMALERWGTMATREQPALYKVAISILDITRPHDDDQSSTGFAEFSGHLTQHSQLHFERVMSEWVMAMRRMPPWAVRIEVTATPPAWLDRKALEVFMARMQTVALFKTHGRVEWAQKISHQAPFF